MSDVNFGWDAELHAEIAAFGAALGPQVRDGTADLYVSRHLELPGIEVARDVAYGPDAQHRLDVYQRAVEHPRTRSVLCFVHGGGFVGGDKHKLGQPYYDNVGIWAAANGFVGVTINYRLAPEFPYPSGAEDVALALSWIEEHAREFGGDGARVVVMGHSAGASHVASCIASPDLRQAPMGAVLSSGVYDPSIGASAYATYFGDDPLLRASRSSIKGVCESGIPLLVSSTEYDPKDIQLQTIAMVTEYARLHGSFPEFVHVDGHNHYSVMYQFGTEETWYSERVRRFVTSLPRGGGSSSAVRD